MSKNNHSSILGVLTRTTLALVFLFGQTTWAGQGRSATDKSTSSAAAKPEQPASPMRTDGGKARSGQEEAASAENAWAQEKAERGGRHEGIKVHGHWTIEVRNPDGSLTTHREFENSLISAPGAGAMLLSNILARQFTLGSWVILLSASADLDSIIIDEAGASFASGRAQNCASSATLISCSTNLTLTASGDGSFTLAGSAVVPPTSFNAITSVRTFAGVCLPSTSTQVCPQTGEVNGYSLTMRFLDGLNGNPPPVSVSPGQTVAVSVNISFS